MFKQICMFLTLYLNEQLQSLSVNHWASGPDLETQEVRISLTERDGRQMIKTLIKIKVDINKSFVIWHCYCYIILLLLMMIVIQMLLLLSFSTRCVLPALGYSQNTGKKQKPGGKVLNGYGKHLIFYIAPSENKSMIFKTFIKMLKFKRKIKIIKQMFETF